MFQVKLLGDRTKKSDATTEQIKGSRQDQSRHGASGSSSQQPQSKDTGSLMGSKGHSMGVQVNLDISEVDVDGKLGLSVCWESKVSAELLKCEDEIGGEEVAGNWGFANGVALGGKSQLVMACG